MTITPVIKVGRRGRHSTTEGPQPNIFNTQSNSHRDIPIDKVEDKGIPPLPNVSSKSGVDGCFHIRAASLKKQHIKAWRV
jgi:hypothetical protein